MPPRSANTGALRIKQRWVDSIACMCVPSNRAQHTKANVLRQLATLPERSDILDLGDLVGVGLHIDVPLDEEDVVDLVLAPQPVAGREVVDASEVREVLNGHLW